MYCMKNYLAIAEVGHLTKAYKSGTPWRRNCTKISYPRALWLFPELPGEGDLLLLAGSGVVDVHYHYHYHYARHKGAYVIPKTPSDVRVTDSQVFSVLPGDVLFLTAEDIVDKWLVVTEGVVFVLLRDA